MTGQQPPGRVLYVVVCGAGPASDVSRLVQDAHRRGWQVSVIATPAALAFLEVPALEADTGNPVRSEYRASVGPAPRSVPNATAVVVAPGTYNTINKWAAGVSDTYALGVLAESVGLGIPTVVVPFVNTALAARAPFRRAVEALRAEGVRIILGAGEHEPHPPGTGGDRAAAFPWVFALDEAERLSKPDPNR